MANIARKAWGTALCIAVATVAGLAFNQETTTTPLVSLPNDSLYVNGSKSKINLTLALSVEMPTLGSAYTGASGDLADFRPSQRYVGYFDNMVCYVSVTTTGISGGEYFSYSSAKSAIDDSCPSGTSFDGNFLNWATTSAIDIMRYGLTGGRRVFDEGTGAGRTILERAYLPDRLYRSNFFPLKRLRVDEISLRTPFNSSLFAEGMYIRNCRNRVYFSKVDDTTGNCAEPFLIANAQSPQLIKGSATRPGELIADDNTTPRFYQTRVLVCDPATASNRLMVQNPETQRWNGLCMPYKNASGGSFYKPVGQFQVSADNVRVSVFSYLNDSDYYRNGGVMRSPLKYLGPRQFDANYNLMAVANPHSEWDSVTGVFTRNPQSGHADYGDQGYGQSGAINYINGFGALDPDALGSAKDWDPLSELYYEAFRYLQGQQPTPSAIARLIGTSANDRSLTENFPAYLTWTDPFAGFVDNAGEGRSCLRNSVLAIADAFTHADRSLPGNTVDYKRDAPRDADTTPVPLDVEKWTKVVASFEANLGVDYTDSTGTAQKALNIALNNPYRVDLSNIATDVAVESSGSYLMAGLAYFANTQSFRADLPKARISTFSIDVNTYNKTGSNATLRRGTQLFLAAKYGGFDDSLTGNTGSPYAAGDNLSWQATDGDARNYFVVSDPQTFLDSISDVFRSLTTETRSIAGGAASSQQLRSDEAAAVFQASFNPVANDWSGRVRKFALSLSSSTAEIALATTPEWDASQELTLRTGVDHGADRNIVVGAPLGQQGTVEPSSFVWDGALASAHKAALNRDASGTADSLGPDRLNYLRGDRRQEQSSSNPLLPFRPRQLVLGSVVNAGLVYQGAPTPTLSGTGYSAFRETNKARTPLVFANANDGMLHAFRASDGSEAFAYIPGFIVPRLHTVPDITYTHRPLLDATPTAAEAQIGGQWRSVLVSGAGAGAQGIFAIDVTDPEGFTKDNVLWEFTDADHPALGNVLGKPRVARVRMNDAGAATDSYKWMAIVPGGVNNHRSDANTNSNAHPSIFLIDLEARPSPSRPWQEGVNFWRIELPPGDASTAPGLIQITAVQTPGSGNLEAILAGDLQGNVWNLSFRERGVNSFTTDGLSNLEQVNAMGENDEPMFVARSSADKRQPITSAPVTAIGFGGKRLVVVGTGKFLEVTDNSAPTSPPASLYALLDSSSTITGRSRLQSASIDTRGEVSTDAFQYGTAESQREGWVLDFPSSAGERQVTEMQLDRGILIFTTLSPAGGACSGGGGRGFNIDVLTGRGSSWDSSVGLPGPPMVLEKGNAVVSGSSTSGRRTATYRMGVLLQGSMDSEAESSQFDITLQVGRMSWRQVHNHRDLLP
ncbi:pilus assembly protein [Hydrogenophaga sp.]|uniref:pilus assembly protein n=1 Tax=Hydrogenophaga sp. TaxID=1904254 RepID=UPI002FC64692